ncbi:MAG: SRPBCC family protein [Steroidobacteraceae bacterium]
MTLRGLAGALWLATASAGAAAYDVRDLVADYSEHRYRVRLTARLDAPPAAVMAVLTRYERYPSLDPRIREARVQAGADGQRRLVTLLEGCVGSWLCRDLKRVESLREAPLVLEAIVVPEESDLRYGRTVTTLTSEGEGTHVEYTSEFELGFWAPAWLVRRPMLRTLESGTRDMFAAVEEAARAEPGAPRTHAEVPAP